MAPPRLSSISNQKLSPKILNNEHVEASPLSLTNECVVFPCITDEQPFQDHLPNKTMVSAQSPWRHNNEHAEHAFLLSMMNGLLHLLSKTIYQHNEFYLQEGLITECAESLPVSLTVFSRPSTKYSSMS